jgi:hypothetical protein
MIKNKEGDSFNGQTVRFILENGKVEKSMVLECGGQRKVIHIWDNGKMELLKVKEFIKQLQVCF